MISLLHSCCRALKSERDAWKRACDELERRYAGVMPIEGARLLLEPAPAQVEGDFLRVSAERRKLADALARQTEHSARVERELAHLRQEHRKLQVVLAREKDRIGRAVRDLKLIRETWLNSRRLLAEASADRHSV